MLALGQVPSRWSGDAPDVLAMLRSYFAPDGGGQDGGDGGNGGGGSAGNDGDPPKGKDGTAFDPDRAQRTIDRQTAELKELRAAAKERDDLAARLRAIEDKDKTDSEKLAGDLKSTTDKLSKAEQRAADLEAKYQTTLIRAAIDRESSKAGATDPDDVFALLAGKVGNDITIDESGEVKGADKAVDALKKSKAYLFGGTSGGGNVKGVGGTPNSDGRHPATTDELYAKAKGQGYATL